MPFGRPLYREKDLLEPYTSPQGVLGITHFVWVDKKGIVWSLGDEGIFQSPSIWSTTVSICRYV